MRDVTHADNDTAGKRHRRVTTLRAMALRANGTAGSETGESAGRRGRPDHRAKLGGTSVPTSNTGGDWRSSGRIFRPGRASRATGSRRPTRPYRDRPARVRRPRHPPTRGRALSVCRPGALAASMMLSTGGTNPRALDRLEKAWSGGGVRRRRAIGAGVLGGGSRRNGFEVVDQAVGAGLARAAATARSPGPRSSGAKLDDLLREGTASRRSSPVHGDLRWMG